jgi:hypothetical protein
MPKGKRNQRVDSITGEKLLMSTPAPKVPEHIHLTDEALIVWEAIVDARAYMTWTRIDLEHAANLASCLADIERLRREIREEGDIIENQKGTPIINPRHSLLEILSRRAVALSRLLHVHAEATVGESREQRKRNDYHEQAQAKKDHVLNDDDGLIARPTH